MSGRLALLAAAAAPAPPPRPAAPVDEDDDGVVLISDDDDDDDAALEMEGAQAASAADHRRRLAAVKRPPRIVDEVYGVDSGRVVREVEGVKHLCDVCGDVLTDPKACGLVHNGYPCQTVLCGPCALTYRANNAQKASPRVECPTCKGQTKLDQAPCLSVLRAMARTLIKCKWPGCPQEYELGQDKIHLAMCTYRRAPCPQCLAPQVVVDMDKNHTYLRGPGGCPKLSTLCLVCGERVLWNAQVHDEHRQAPELARKAGARCRGEMLCPFECKGPDGQKPLLVFSSQLSAHCAVCARRPVVCESCPPDDDGDAQTVPHCDLARHNVAQAQAHSEYLLRCVQDLKTQIAKKRPTINPFGIPDDFRMLYDGDVDFEYGAPWAFPQRNGYNWELFLCGSGEDQHFKQSIIGLFSIRVFSHPTGRPEEVHSGLALTGEISVEIEMLHGKTTPKTRTFEIVSYVAMQRTEQDRRQNIAYQTDNNNWVADESKWDRVEGSRHRVVMPVGQGKVVRQVLRCASLAKFKAAKASPRRQPGHAAAAGLPAPRAAVPESYKTVATVVAEQHAQMNPVKEQQCLRFIVYWK